MQVSEKKRVENVQLSEEKRIIDLGWHLHCFTMTRVGGGKGGGRTIGIWRKLSVAKVCSIILINNKSDSMYKSKFTEADALLRYCYSYCVDVTA